MKQNTIVAVLLAVVLILLGDTALLLSQEQEGEVITPFSGMQTNENVINGWRERHTNLRDSLAVFRRIFAGLNDTVTVYPSENYYYFSFTAEGKSLCGSMSLFPHERDSGRIGFGYTEKQDKNIWPGDSLVGGWGTFGASQGIIIEKIDRRRYRITCDRKPVVFQFHDVATAPPARRFLRSDEAFVLRNLDESGVSFVLLFNTKGRRFYWILDPEQPQVETMRRLTDQILIGERTGFAYYNHQENHRMVLIGVEGYNIVNNNWYDGPFDQLPDNQIESGEFELQSYIELGMPYLRGKINRFGHYIDNPASRVALAPYLVYFSEQELIDAYTACVNDGGGRSEFLTCLTQQIFIIPNYAFSTAVATTK